MAFIQVRQKKLKVRRHKIVPCGQPASRAMSALLAAHEQVEVMISTVVNTRGWKKTYFDE